MQHHQNLHRASSAAQSARLLQAVFLRLEPPEAPGFLARSEYREIRWCKFLRGIGTSPFLTFTSNKVRTSRLGLPPLRLVLDLRRPGLDAFGSGYANKPFATSLFIIIIVASLVVGTVVSSITRQRLPT